MLHERTNRPSSVNGVHRSSVPNVARFGVAEGSVKAIAWGLSVALHGGLLASAYFLPWQQERGSNPELQFAKGDRAIQVMVVSSPGPDTLPVPVVSPGAPASHEQPNPVHTTIEATIPFAWLERSTNDAESFHELATVSSYIDERLPLVVADSNSVAPDSSQPNSDTPFASVSESDCEEETTPSLVAPWELRIGFGESGPGRPNREAALAVPPVVDDVPTDMTLGAETGVEVVNLPKPKYPLASFRRGESGLVMLEVEVLPDGSVGRIKVIRDAGFPRLSAASIAAVRGAVFLPAMRRGIPVRDIVRIPFRFVLK